MPSSDDPPLHWSLAWTMVFRPYQNSVSSLTGNTNPLSTWAVFLHKSLQHPGGQTQFASRWTRRQSSTGVSSVFSGYTRALSDYKPSIILSALHKLLSCNQWNQWEWTKCLDDIWNVTLIWQVVTVLAVMARWHRSSSSLSLAARGDTPSGKLIVLVARLIYWWSAPNRDNEFMGFWLMSEWTV